MTLSDNVDRLGPWGRVSDSVYGVSDGVYGCRTVCTRVCTGVGQWCKQVSEQGLFTKSDEKSRNEEKQL